MRVLIFIILLVLISCSKESISPTKGKEELPYLGVEFLYPSDSIKIDSGDTLRVSIKYRADAGMHEVGMIVKDNNHRVLAKVYKHSHQGNIYIYDTIWVPSAKYSQLWFVGILSDHLNNFATDSVCVFVNQ